MSSTASSLREYVVIVKDFPGTLDQRLKVRAQHMDGAKADNQMSLMPTGGGIADEFPNEGEQFQFVGSMLLMKAENKDKVVERLKKDIYATSGVWDVDNAQIYAVSKKGQ